MNDPSSSPHRTLPALVKVLWVLVALTAVFSLLYGIQYYLGGPVKLQTVNEFRSLALSPNKDILVAGADDGLLRLWDLPARVRTVETADFDVSREDPWDRYDLSGYAGPVIQAAFTPDGATLITTDRTGWVRLWDVSGLLTEDGGPIKPMQGYATGGGPLVAATVSADGSTLATITADGSLHVWNPASQEELRIIDPGDEPRHSVALSSDGALVATDRGLEIEIWEVSSGEVVQTLQPHCENRELLTYEACEEANKDILGHDEEITALAFSPADDLLASGSADSTIVFWELETAEAKYSSSGHWSTITALEFGEDGGTLLSGGQDNKSRTIRVVGGKSTAIFEGHLAPVSATQFGPEESVVLTAGEDGTVRLWERANQRVLHLEWSQLGLQPVWGKLLAAWMLISGILAVVSLLGLVRLRIWGHLLALAVFLIGPIIVLGLPIFEVFTYPLSLADKLQIGWPLLALGIWYIALLVVLTREKVALEYQTVPSAQLDEQIMVSQRTVKLRTGIYGVAVWFSLLMLLFSVLRRFNLDLSFMGNFLEFIMLGSGITFYVSILAIMLAVVLALMGALGRLSKSPIASGISGFYISLIRGTPLLVQIFIWYLGLPRLGIVLPAIPAGILALGVNYGAYMTEIFRAGIQAISKGQHEAAQALGMTKGQTFRRIVLPQAFRIVIPPIGNQFIAMMKDSSLVSVMAVRELTWRADKIGRQYFRGLETFIIAAAFYWVLTVVFQLLQGRLEEYMARGERR